jgi:hypothetical protein
VELRWPGKQYVTIVLPILMPLSQQVVWLLVLALPIASVAWTVTHEEVFREPREYCLHQSNSNTNLLCRKFFYLFTCEYCFSHWVALLFLLITRFKLLYMDWRGYVIALFALVYVANFYMGVFGHVKLEVKKTRVEVKAIEAEVEKAEEGLNEPFAGAGSKTKGPRPVRRTN